MAHRTRRRAVKRAKRDAAKQAKLAKMWERFHDILAGIWLANLEREDSIYDRMLRKVQELIDKGEAWGPPNHATRLRYEDIPDGPRIAGRYSQVIFGSGEVSN